MSHAFFSPALSGVPSPSAVTFFATLVADTCDIALPPINTASILRVYIHDLELPEVRLEIEGADRFRLTLAI